jgi:hypothetical protein
MRVLVIHKLSAVCVAAAALTASANASAQHYYGVLVNWNVGNGDADQGSAVTIDTDVLSTWDCPNFKNFVNHEMWYDVVPGTYWVEVGFKEGIDYYNNCDYDVDFWADKRNGGGYHEHFPGNSWNFDTGYQAVVQQPGQTNNCSWDVWLGGVYLGTSTSNCPGTSRKLAAGLETTAQSNSWARGWLWGWQRLDSSRNWWGGWDGAGGSQNNPPNIQWANSSQTETEEVLNESW